MHSLSEINQSDAHIFGDFHHEGLVELFMGFHNCLVCTLSVAVALINSCLKSSQKSARFVLEGREKNNSSLTALLGSSFTSRRSDRCGFKFGAVRQIS